MASFVTENDGDFTFQLNPVQGDSNFLPFDADEYELQLDQDAGFMFASNDEGAVHQQSDELADQDAFVEWEPEQEQPDLFTQAFTGAIRSFTPDGFTSNAAAADDPAATYSEYYHWTYYQEPPAAAASSADATYSEYRHDGMDTEFVVGEEANPSFPVEEAPASSEAAFAAALEVAEAPTDDCCPVCLVQDDDDDGKDAATWCRVTACGHRFHAACVEKWFKVKPTCPVCRCSAAAAEHQSVAEELMALGYGYYEVIELVLSSVNVPR